LLGGKDGALDFFPSLCRSARGIGNALWAFVEHPIDTTTNFCNECYELGQITAEYCQAFDWKTAEGYVDEVKQLCEEFDELSDAEKGHLIGYSIGKYGIEVFAGATSIKAYSAYKKVREANRICNLEAIIASSSNKETILSTAANHALQRDHYFKNVKYNFDAHNKHILGHNDYREWRSIWTHPEPERLFREFAGKGLPHRGQPGMPGYKENVDFKEVIGIWKDKEKIIELPTTRGELHYGKKGGHIVPIAPNPIIRKP